MQPHSYIEVQHTELATPTQSYLSCASGKVSNPHLNVAIVKLVVRKYNIDTLRQHIIKLPISKHSYVHFQTKSLFYKALLHATVRRRGEAPRKLNSNSNRNLTMSLKLSKLQPLTRGISCINRMTGQGKCTARILTEDSDFVMMDTSSPPQGHKRIGGNRTSSEEERTKATSEKRSKSIPKEKNQLTPQF